MVIFVIFDFRLALHDKLLLYIKIYLLYYTYKVLPRANFANSYLFFYQNVIFGEHKIENDKMTNDKNDNSEVLILKIVVIQFLSAL